MEDAIRQRINEILSFYEITINRFSNGDSALQNRLSRQLSRGSAITSDTICLILSRFSDVSSEWLLRGKGEMIKPQQKPTVAAAGAAIGAAIGVLAEPGISAISTLNGLSSSTEPENEDINKDSQDEQIDSQRTIEVLIKVIETYQNRVDDLLNVVESLKNENTKLKSQLESKKAS